MIIYIFEAINAGKKAIENQTKLDGSALPSGTNARGFTARQSGYINLKSTLKNYEATTARVSYVAIEEPDAARLLDYIFIVSLKRTANQNGTTTHNNEVFETMVANIRSGDVSGARECNYNGNSEYITSATNNTNTDSNYIYARYRGVRD